jgi:hemerythrin
MPLLSWKPEYSVNREDLDHHHQEMFHILNSVYDNLMDSQELSFLIPSIDRLSAIANYHLSIEEQCLREMHVPDIEHHIAKHREFTESIEMIRSDYQDNYLEASKELIILLGEWLFNHVLKEDRKYSPMIGNSGTGGQSQVNQ